MSRTGRYVWDEQTRQLVKVSDTVPSAYRDLRNGVWWPQGESSYYDRQAARTFHSRAGKAAWMREKGVIEHGTTYQNPLRGLAEQGQAKPTRHRGVLHV